MNEYKALSRFLITRFLQITIVTALVEAVIYRIVNDVFLNQIFKTPLSVTELFFLFFSLFIRTLAAIVDSFFPFRIASLLEIVIFRMLPAGKTLSELYSSSFPKSIVMWLILFATIVIIMVPYVVAATVFSRIVIREVRSMEKLDRQKASEHERYRNLMLSDIAHDIRTPITSIAGYAKALEDGLIEEDKKNEIYSTMQSKSERLNELINLLFEYTRLDSEGYELTMEKLDVNELVRESVAYCYQDIEDAGMELCADIPDEPFFVDADKMQMERVIHNLLINAIRHNEKGTQIGVFAEADEDILTVSVCDNGEQIDKDIAAHLFEPFVTTDGSRRSGSGTGLGLSIVKKIIDMHGFTIELRQGEWKGYKKRFVMHITSV